VDPAAAANKLNRKLTNGWRKSASRFSSA